MEAHMSLLIGGSQRLFKVSGKVPQVDQQLIDQLEQISGVNRAQAAYGETWLGVSAEAVSPLETASIIQSIRSLMAQRGLTLEQVNPVKR